MTFYSDMADTADELLTEFGQTVTLNRVMTGAYDPATGSASTSTSTQTGRGAIFDYKTADIDNSLIKQGDKRLLLSPDGITAVTTGDAVVISSVTYTVTMVKQINPAGTVVMYDVNLRGA